MIKNRIIIKSLIYLLNSITELNIHYKWNKTSMLLN